MSSCKFLIPATAALLAASAVPSHATLMISLADNLGDSLSVTDQGAGDINPTLGAATFSGSIGNFIVNVTTGLSKPVIGSATDPKLDLNSVDVTSSLGGKLTLEVTDTDFTGGAGIADFISSIGGTQGAGGALTYSTFMDCGNAAFGQGTPLSTQSFSGVGAFSGNGSNGTLKCAGTYSLTEEVTLTLPGAGDTSFDAALAIPEPASLAMLGMGLLAFAGLLRRRA